MKPKNIRPIVIIGLFFFQGFSTHLFAYAPPDSSFQEHYSPENINRFADYLFLQKDYLRAAAEYQRILFYESNQKNNTIYFQLGRCYLKSRLLETASTYFQKSILNSETPSQRDSSTVGYIISLILNDQIDSVENIADSLVNTKTIDNTLRSMVIKLKILSLLQQSNWKYANSLMNNNDVYLTKQPPTLEQLQHFYNRGINLPQKSPAFAGLLSAIIPGSGRIYAGRFVDGLYSMILISSTGWLSYEGFRDGGSESFKGWLFGCVSAVFYAGNVYGSVVTARLNNKRIKDKLANDIQYYIDLSIEF